MDYGQARAFVEQTRKKTGSVYGLDGIESLMERLGGVQERLAVIHVAGTNGKGSVCTMLAGILQEAGYRVGKYSSPPVFTYTEIFQVNGADIEKERYAALITRIAAVCADIQASGLAHPAAFEIETAAAFCYFYEEKCDYVLLEAGLGGRDDATNLIRHPVCSVITSVGRDHMELLGETAAEIARAKVGIIKAGCPVVSSGQQPGVMEVIRQAASGNGCELTVADPDQLRGYDYDAHGSRFVHADTEKPYTAGVTGAFQRDNIACVLAVVGVLRGRGIVIPEDAVQRALAKASVPGRMQRIGTKPDFYLDGAHNEPAAYFLRETVQKCFTNRRIVYIIGVLRDKEHEKVLKILLPFAAGVYTVTPDNVRALDAESLAREASRYHAVVTAAPDLAYAAKMARSDAGMDGIVLAFGSLSYLGALRDIVVQE